MNRNSIKLTEATGKTVKSMSVSFDPDYNCVEVELTDGAWHGGGNRACGQDTAAGPRLTGRECPCRGNCGGIPERKGNGAVSVNSVFYADGLPILPDHPHFLANGDLRT
jgi:hypothetical protein